MVNNLPINKYLAMVNMVKITLLWSIIFQLINNMLTIIQYFATLLFIFANANESR